MPNLYVRAVPGRLVTRFGSSQYIGATRVFPHPTPEQLENGAEPIVWDAQAVTVIPEREAAKYRREYEGAIRHGDLVQCTPEEQAAYIASLEAPTSEAAPQETDK